MNQNDTLLHEAFTAIKEDSYPTEDQKERMFNAVLEKYEEEDHSLSHKLKKMVYVYPWRCALAMSALQTLVLTLIFGTKYTDLLLSIFKG